jgi:hypothetical protein
LVISAALPASCCIATNGCGTLQLTRLPGPCSLLSGCQVSKDTTQKKLLDVRKYDVISETSNNKDLVAGKNYAFEYSLVRCASTAAPVGAAVCTGTLLLLC